MLVLKYRSFNNREVNYTEFTDVSLYDNRNTVDCHDWMIIDRRRADTRKLYGKGWTGGEDIHTGIIHFCPNERYGRMFLEMLEYEFRGHPHDKNVIVDATDLVARLDAGTWKTDLPE